MRAMRRGVLFRPCSTTRSSSIRAVMSGGRYRTRAGGKRATGQGCQASRPVHPHPNLPPSRGKGPGRAPTRDAPTPGHRTTPRRPSPQPSPATGRGGRCPTPPRLGCEVPASAGMAQGLVRPRKGMKMGRHGLSLASVLGTPTFPERCFGSASGSAQHDNRGGGEVPACAGTTGQGAGLRGSCLRRNDRYSGSHSYSPVKPVCSGRWKRGRRAGQWQVSPIFMRLHLPRRRGRWPARCGPRPGPVRS